ncbi:DUF4377 domain-containing protein [Alistipes sp.]|uniref:DUF4377 domain-containing protein n=1 Tax=Alistipes sp. TaxID=1872444 RepID=UPI003AF0FA9E
MKRTLFLACLTFLAACALVSCDKDEPRTLRLTVASERTVVTEPTGNFEIPTYLVIYPGESQWRHFGGSPIEGFDDQYQTGYEYVIDVEIIPVKNPPQDAPNVEYRLIRIVSQEKKHSAGLPDTSPEE